MNLHSFKCDHAEIIAHSLQLCTYLAEVLEGGYFHSDYIPRPLDDQSSCTCDRLR